MKCKRKWSLLIAKWAALVLLLAGLFLGAQYWLWLSKAHEVVPGVLYRSAQLSTAQFARAVHENKIRTVLNLCGGNFSQSIYAHERALAAKENIAYYHLPLSAYEKPTKAQLLELVRILQTSQRPLLIHCNGGADRTGLASAIYLILQNKPIGQAEKQYSLHYYVIHSASVGKLVIPAYINWLQKNKLFSSKQNFLNWLSQS
jgi:protein tyrosine/serine phosphatase